MEIIHHALAAPDETLPAIAVSVDRRTLAKTRWRGVAADERVFGFELHHPLTHGAAFFQTTAHRYVIEQLPEILLRVSVSTAEDAARVGWMIGNLHFPAQVRDDAIFVEADPAIRQMFARENIRFDESEGVFEPLKAAAGHGHHHH